MMRLVAAAAGVLTMIGVSACANTSGNGGNQLGDSGSTTPGAGRAGISSMAEQWGMGTAIPPPGSPNTGA